MFLYISLAVLVGLAAGQDNRKIDAEGCGQAPLGRDMTAGHRIVGGVEAAPYSYPFICSLEQGGSHICGGSLVRNMAGTYYFITAAHCVDRAARFYTARCAIHDRSTNAGNQPYSQVLSFSDVQNHEGYDPNTFANDISVFTLSSQPITNNYLQPVCVAVGDYTAGEDATVIGWGTLSEGGTAARYLMEVSKPVLSDAECSSAYGSEFDANTMVCSGLLGVGGVDACQGDSGGPMVAYRNGSWELIGVVSWGYGCARPQYPGVYADVYRLKTWISSKINV